MQLEHQFTVPVPVAQAWDVLLDVERVAPCVPGATVESFDGETVDGRVKVKVGPIQVTYTGTAKFVERDAAARKVVLEASAKEARGTGTADATVTAVLTDGGARSTDVTVTTDLQVTGRPAQFGRGVMVEVGNRLIGKFADCLADELGVDRPTGQVTATPAASPEPAAGAPAAPAATEAAPGPQTAAAAKDVAAATASSDPQATSAPPPLRRVPATHDDEAELSDAAGGPVLKKVLPAAGVAVLLLVLWRLLVRPRG